MEYKEHKNKCDDCQNKVDSRIYWMKIAGKFKWLCKDCWEFHNNCFFKKRP